MKRILVILLALVMMLSLGMANADAVDNAERTGTDLISLGYSAKEGEIIEGDSTDINADNFFDRIYSSLIYANTEKGMIEYHLGGEYKTLELFFYIPDEAISNGRDQSWDAAAISVYTDEELLFTVSQFAPFDTPLPLIIDVENAQYLRFEFDNVCYYYNGNPCGLAAIGEPILYK